MDKNKLEEFIITGGIENAKGRIIDFTKDIVANYYGMDTKDCFSTKTRKREIIQVRHVAIYLIMTNVKTSTTSLGREFNYDHATIIHAVKKISGYLTWDVELKREIAEMQNLIKLKALAVTKGMDINNDFYFIDMNNFHSIKLSTKKAIILVGFDESEIKSFQFAQVMEGGGHTSPWQRLPEEEREHKGTGMYVMEKREDKDEKI